MSGAGILGVSLVLQLLATILAIRLTWVTTRRWAWGFIALATALMTARRCFTLYRSFYDPSYEADVLAELVALSISIAQVIGFGWIVPPLTESSERLLQRELDRFLGGPAIVFQWRAAEGWPVDYVSPNVKAVFGRSAADFLAGRVRYAAMIHPDDLERVGAEVAAHTAAGARTFEQEYRIIRPDGAIRWLYDYTVVTRDPNGRVRHYSGYVLDTTERRRALEQQMQLTAMVESTDDAVVRTSREGVIQSWNEAATRMYGYSAEEVIGQSVTMLAPRERSAQWSALFSELQRGLRVGRLETDRLTKTGQQLAVALTMSPILDEKGAFVGALLIARDLAEQQRTALALRESEERFHAFMSNIPAPAFMKDSQGRLMHINPAFEREFGFNNVDWRGKTDAELWPPNVAKQFRDHDRLVLRSRKPLAMEEIVEVAGVKRRWLTVRFMFKDADGNDVLAGVGMSLDEASPPEGAIPPGAAPGSDRA